jgi:TatD DNase family protein
MEEWVQHPKVAFWGEIGLDYHYKNSPPEQQRSALRTQLQLAHKHDLPVSLHCRDAWRDVLAILKQESDGRKYRGILHNFTGNEEHARECLKLGLLISFSGILTFKDSGKLREVARNLRLDQILLETDAPYVAPAPYRGRRNEPAYVAMVARTLAELMDVSFDDIARNTTANFRRLIRHGDREKGETLVYAIRDRLYVNLTNRCTARCVFCRRESEPVASGYDLTLHREPPASEYLKQIGDPAQYAQIVFCGFGEPTLRLAELVEIGRAVKAGGGRLRLNTNGHGNLIHGRDVVPELASFLEEISISIDAADAASYHKLVRPDFGEQSFEAVLDFIRSCVGRIPKVTITAVALPGLDLTACEELARDLNVEFRAREYQAMVGSTDFVRD